MPIKLKSLIKKQAQEEQTPKPEKSGREIFRAFVQKATAPEQKDDPYWEQLRQQITPQKYTDVSTMFARWRVLAGIKKQLKP